jgi:hypothetical protein
MKKTFFIVVLLMAFGVYNSSAQIFVTVRPERPHYERTIAPSPRHVWIDEEWEPRGNAYAFTGGHWAEPPHGHAHWQQGHWENRDRDHQSQWRPGHWRR